MKNIFEINGKEYDAIPFTFNTVCQLEDMGLSIDDMGKKPVSMFRAYFALCVGDVEKAGNEINEHLIAGGDLTGLLESMSKELEESGFFKAMVRNIAPQDHKKPKSTTTKEKK